MSRSDQDAKLNTDEFSRIFDEYRAKIQEITRKTEKEHQSSGKTADNAGDSIAEKIEEIVVSRLPESKARPQGLTAPPAPESAAIIEKAKREAQRIIEEAEESARKEAKKRTKGQIEKLLDKARKEAEDTTANARKAAEEEREEIIAASKQQAEYFIKELTETCRQETQAQSSRAIAEAREKAMKMMADIIASSMEISRLVTEIVNRARNSFYEFETMIQKDTDELIKAIAETQNTLKQITSSSPEEEENMAVLAPVESPVAATGKNKEVYTSPTLKIHLLGEKTNGNNGSQPLFRGQVEMRSVSSSFDYQYLKNLKKYLLQIPKIKYLQESASEEEMSAIFEVQEPLPLLEILKNFSLVDRVVTEADDIAVTFKNFA